MSKQKDSTSNQGNPPSTTLKEPSQASWKMTTSTRPLTTSEEERENTHALLTAVIEGNLNQVNLLLEKDIDLTRRFPEHQNHTIFTLSQELSKMGMNDNHKQIFNVISMKSPECKMRRVSTAEKLKQEEEARNKTTSTHQPTNTEEKPGLFGRITNGLGWGSGKN